MFCPVTQLIIKNIKEKDLCNVFLSSYSCALACLLTQTDRTNHSEAEYKHSWASLSIYECTVSLYLSPRVHSVQNGTVHQIKAGSKAEWSQIKKGDYIFIVAPSFTDRLTALFIY